MRTPSVDMITDSLGSCSLGRGDRTVATSPPSAATLQRLPAADSDHTGRRVAVELNSEAALPCHWEQFLDLKTGEVYYINLVTAVRTTKDPRAMAATDVAYQSSYCMTPSDDDYDDYDNDDYDYDVNDDGNSSSGVDDDDDDDDDEGSGICSPSAPEASIGDSPGGGKTLVAAGCKSCLMYFMVPKHVDGCPKCGGRLLHLC